MLHKVKTGMVFLAATACAVALGGCFSHENGKDSRIVLENGGHRVEVAPGLGGRVSLYAANGESNALWFAMADTPTVGWLNHGGEKTWLGPQSLWKTLGGKRWPPPAFFDQGRYEVVKAPRGRKSVIIMSPPDTGGGLRVSRTITLLDDGSLMVSSRLVQCTDSPIVPVEELRLWSVVQVPLPKGVEAVSNSDGAVFLTPEGGEKLHEGLSPSPLTAVRGTMQLTAATDTKEDASAAVFFTGTNVPPDSRYAELEFSAPAANGLTVRYTIGRKGNDDSSIP